MISIDDLARNDNGHARAMTRKEQWFVETRAGIFPMTPDAIEQSLERGLIHATTKVWTSGMQAWVALGSIAGFTTAPYPPPLPAAGPRSAEPMSMSPPPPVVQTVIRRRVEPSAPAVPGSLARGRNWLQRLETWHCVLFSFVAGTALGLAIYHPLLRRAANEPVSQPLALAPAAASMPSKPLVRAEARPEQSERAAAPLQPPPALEPAAQPAPEPTAPPSRAAKHRRSRVRAPR
jgi:hypothetical protein